MMSDFTEWRPELEVLARAALRQAKHAVSREYLARFLQSIEASVEAYYSRSKDVGAPRKAHDAMRRLWQSLNDPDPSIRLIRSRTQALPLSARTWVLKRAALHWPCLVGGDYSEAAFDRWILSAEATDLVEVLKVLVSEGGRLMIARPDRPTSLHFEPMIMGVIRGMGEGFGKGGRPSLSARDELVMHLAIDWMQATGEPPQRGRRDCDGFSGLVHRIFDVLEVVNVQGPDEVPDHNGAEQALRRYWAAVENRGYPPLRKT